jgi:hypothetical protein
MSYGVAVASELKKRMLRQHVANQAPVIAKGGKQLFAAVRIEGSFEQGRGPRARL